MTSCRHLNRSVSGMAVVCDECGTYTTPEPTSPSVSAFIEWNQSVERQAVIAVSKMFPTDHLFKLEAAKPLPCAATALDHLRALHADDLIADDEFYVAYHILQHTLVG